MKWDVITILAGEFGPMPEWMRIRSEGIEPGENIPSYVYLLKSGGHNVLVDASFSSVKDIETHMGIYCRREKSIEESLAEYGVKDTDIEIVVLTHLHWDHAGGAFKYPNARVVCQQAEYDWMCASYKWDAGYPGWFCEEFMKESSKLTLIDGEAQLLPGLKAMLYGGHTPGSQMVSAETTDGICVIPGDNIMSYENIERNVPVGLFCDIHGCIASIELVKKLDAVCLPSHDWKAIGDKR